jgi:3'-phosphoadenosine 5'-phosphosulfate sulfotransferase (PAPS reductase)/FAD synthetase
MSNQYSERLTKLIDIARHDIEAALVGKVNPLVAYSGGKDGNVVMHLVNTMTKVKGVCEMSFYYEKQKQDIEDSAARLNYELEVKESLDWNWLSRHSRFVFAEDVKLRADRCRLRQQTSVKKQGLLNKSDIVIFGRRTQENSVKSKLYEANGLLNFHPIREWRHEDVWEYIDRTPELEVPWIYSQYHGQKAGNSPFYSLRLKHFDNSYDKAWEYCTSIDPTINRERLNAS